LTEHPWFALTGKHASQRARNATPEILRNTPDSHRLRGCHRKEFTTTENPPHLGVLPETCGGCHSSDGWLPATVTEHPWFQLDASTSARLA